MRVRTTKEQVQLVKRRVSIEAGRGYWWLALFTVLYWSCAWALSRSKPLWFDELFTYYFAKLSVTQQIAVLRIGAETNPPGFPWLVGISHAVSGISELTTRLPAMLSYYVFCVLLFVFVRRRMNEAAAWAALILPLGLGAYPFAYEARAYALMLAAAMMAFLGWQNRVLGVTPRAGLLLVGLGALAGVLGHYFAVFMIIAPLGAAECARSWQRRRVDWPLWITLTGATSVLLFLAPLARAASHVFTDVVTNAPSFWARPHMMKLPAFYWTQMQGLLAPLTIAAAVGWWFDRRNAEPGGAQTSTGMSKPELWLMGALLAVPAVSLAFAWLWTGTYLHRYAITGAIGIVLGLCWLLDRLRWDKAAYALIAAIIVLFAFEASRAGARTFNVPRTPPTAESVLPLVISDPLRYLVLAHYRPNGMQQPVPVYLTNRAAVTTLSDFIPEISLDLGKTLLPVDVHDYYQFTGANPRFYLEVTGEHTREWLPGQLLRDRFTLTPISRIGTRTLLLASRSGGVERASTASRQ